MAISDQITAINNAKLAIKTAIEAKGVTVGSAPLSGYAAKISAIPGPSWVRPSDWLALPTITSTDQKFVGLYAVYPYSNFVALTASGAFTVDWGDGTVQNYDAGTTAEHEYDYSNPALNGTLTSRGYKQAVVTLTMQSGQTLTSLVMSSLHSALANFMNEVSNNWLDVAVAGSQISQLLVGPSMLSPNGISASLMLEQVSVLSANVSDATCMFTICMNLQSIPVFNIGNSVQNAFYMFYGCMSLQTAPMFNTSQIADFGSMFYGCTALKIVPTYDTSSGQNMSQMFFNCSALEYIPQLNTAAVTDFSGMLSNCACLASIPLLNMSSATVINEFISRSSSIYTLPAIDLTNIRPAPITYYYPQSLVKCSIIGLSGYLSFSGCLLSTAALNEIYSKLGTAISPTGDDPSSNEIDVSGCYGAAASDTSIATAKGWVVYQ